MKVKIDNVEAGGFPLIPVGRYDVMVTSAVEKLSKANNAYVALELSILNDDGEKSYRGRKVFSNINFNEIGLSILKSILKFNNSPLADKAGEFDLDPASLVGMKFGVKIGQETRTDTDELQNNVKGYKAVSDEYKDATIDVFNRAAYAGGSLPHVQTPVGSPFN